MADNFPVFENEKRGVDFIIGVDVQQKLSSHDQIDTALDMLNQISNYQSHDVDEKKIKDLAIYIHPDVENFSGDFFDKTKELIQSGVKAASSFVPQLQKLKTETSNVKYQREVCLSCNMNDKFTIENINIKVPEKLHDPYAKGRLKIDIGDRLDVSTLIDKILNLTSSKNFNLIQYELNNTEGDTYQLSLDLDENTTSNHLKFGLHYDPIIRIIFIG